MLTGQALFGGETVSHTLADVLRKEIDLNVLPKNTPPAVRTLLGRCLDRDVRTVIEDHPKHFQIFIYDPGKCEVLYTAERTTLPARSC